MLLSFCSGLFIGNTVAQSELLDIDACIKVLFEHYSVVIGDCSSVSYAVQPPTELNCNPVGKLISLACGIKHSDVTLSRLHNVTWYWSRCDQGAGVNGTAILPGDTSDDYWVLVSKNLAFIQLIFQVTNSTQGYYWCEISSAMKVSLKPSIVTPVLKATSLPECTNYSVRMAHNYKFGPECASEGSRIIYSRRKFFSSHLKRRSVNTTISASGGLTNTGTVAIVVVGESVILSILIIVFICIGIIFRKRPSLYM